MEKFYTVFVKGYGAVGSNTVLKTYEEAEKHAKKATEKYKNYGDTVIMESIAYISQPVPEYTVIKL